MDWHLGAAAILLLTAGLAGQAFEMRRIRRSTHGDELGSPNIFADRRNLKWYALIAAGFVLWLVAERGAP